MGIDRAMGLKRLEGFAVRVEDPLAKIAAAPDDLAVRHWTSEVLNWLRQMEAVLPHVGKQTAAQWRERIARYRDTLGRTSDA